MWWIAINLALVGWPAPPNSRDDAGTLCDLLLAAQAEKADKYREGEMEFEINYQRAQREEIGRVKPPPVKVRGRLVWKDENVLWRFRMQDLRRTVATSERVPPLDEAVDEVMLIRGEEVYLFENKTNSLAIYKYNPQSSWITYLDVRPHSMWFRAFSSLHLDSSPLASLIGDQCQVHLPDDTLSVTRDGDRIVHDRHRASGTSITMSFSLADDGNLVESLVVPEPGLKDVGTRSTREWGRASTGECYLKHYRQEQFWPDRPDEPLGHYDLVVSAIDLRPKERSAILSKEALFASLPENVRVSDVIRKTEYVLNPRATLSASQLDPLVPTVRGRGFLQR